MNLSEIEALADAAKVRDAFTGRWMVANIDQVTLLNMCQLIRQQHEALKLIEEGSEFFTCIKDEMSYAAYKDVKQMFAALTAYEEFNK